MWMCRHGAYRGDGAFGQYCVVMPAREAVIASPAGAGCTRSEQYLEPPVPSLATSAGRSAHNRLEERLRSLSLPMLQARNEAAAAINGQTYTMEPNPLGIRPGFAAADRNPLYRLAGAKNFSSRRFGRYLPTH